MEFYDYFQEWIALAVIISVFALHQLLWLIGLTHAFNFGFAILILLVSDSIIIHITKNN